MEIEYRKLIESDIDTFINMRISQLQEEGTKSNEDLALSLKKYYKKHLQDNSFVSWLAIDNGKIIGTSGISFVERPPYHRCPSGKMGILSSMYTVKEYRRKGIAKYLLDKVIDEARKYGCEEVQITASEMGVLLYSDYGFRDNRNFLYYEI